MTSTADGASAEAAERHPITLPEPPSELTERRLRLSTAFKFFGPGAIIASATVGSGESILASREGAAFGYALLWTIVIGTLAKAALVYVGNRYFVLTGEHPVRRMGNVLPGPRGWFPIVIGAIAVLSFPGWASGLAVALGDYLSSMGMGNGTVISALLLVAAATISWFGGYALLERAQIGIVSVKVALVLVAVFVAKPEWLEVLAGFLPGNLEYQPFVADKYPEFAETSVWVEAAVFLGGLGGGMYDYIGYTGMLREKKWGVLGHAEAARVEERMAAAGPRSSVPLATTEDNAARARAWSRAPLIDMLLAFSALAVIAAAFMINGSNILGRAQLIPEGDDVLTHQSRFLSVISPVFTYFYIVAVIMVLFGVMYALWEIYSWTTYECLAAVSNRVRDAGQRAVRPWVYLWVGLSSLAAVLTGADFEDLVAPGAIIGGVFACGVYSFGLLYIEKVNMPQALRVGGLARGLLWLSGFLLSFAGGVSFLELVGVL